MGLRLQVVGSLWAETDIVHAEDPLNPPPHNGETDNVHTEDPSPSKMGENRQCVYSVTYITLYFNVNIQGLHLQIPSLCL